LNDDERALMARVDKAEWRKGYWQADADANNGGFCLEIYTSPSPSFCVGYRERANHPLTVSVEKKSMPTTEREKS
jgi:hypothetical protein